jgi:hypothetical protein
VTDHAQLFSQTPGTLATTSAGETILVNTATGRYYALSRSAALAWDAFAQPRTPAEVAGFVLQQQSGAPATAAADLDILFGELEREGLISPASAPTMAALPSANTLTPYSHPSLDRGLLSRAANGVAGTDDGHTTGFGGTKFS